MPLARRAAARRGRRAGAAVTAGALLVAALSAGLAADAGSPSTSASPSAVAAATPVVPPAPSTPAPVPSPSRARAAVAAAAAAGDGRDDVGLGVAVLDRVTGAVETDAAGTTPMRAASLTKLITAVDVLGRRSGGVLPIGPATEDRVRRSLGPSDDGAMNALWSLYDGNGGVARVAGALGLTATAPPGDPSQWGEATTSARDVAVLLGALPDRLGPADRDLVLGSLATAPPVAADGFDQAYGLLDPATRGAAAAKQGWLCCLDSSVALHSVGFPDPGGRYAVAILSTQPLGYAAARRVLDDAAGAARAALAGD